jgi:hypothetical protein
LFQGLLWKPHPTTIKVHLDVTEFDRIELSRAANRHLSFEASSSSSFWHRRATWQLAISGSEDDTLKV